MLGVDSLVLKERVHPSFCGSADVFSRFFAAPPWYSSEWCLWPLLHYFEDEHENNEVVKGGVLKE